MADITAQQLINAALLKCGVSASGVTPQAADIANALLDLNMLLRQWQRRRWLVYRLADLSCASTGAPAYSVGPGGNIPVDQRPDQIEGAYARFLRGGTVATAGDSTGSDTQAELAPAALGYGGGAMPMDYPLGVIQAREDFAAIGMKGLRAWPQACFYDADTPFGGLYLWPIPPAGAWEIHILVKQSLEGFTDLSANLGLPPEYQEALLYCLVQRLRFSYGLDPDPMLNQLAAAGLATIRTANTRIGRISPAVPGGRGGGVYWPGLEGARPGSFGIGTGAIGVTGL